MLCIFLPFARSRTRSLVRVHPGEKDVWDIERPSAEGIGREGIQKRTPSSRMDAASEGIPLHLDHHRHPESRLFHLGERRKRIWHGERLLLLMMKNDRLKTSTGRGWRVRYQAGVQVGIPCAAMIFFIWLKALVRTHGYSSFFVFVVFPSSLYQYA